MARQLRLRQTCLLAVLLCSGITALYAQDAAWLAERQLRYADWLSGGQGARKPAAPAAPVEDPQQAAAARIRNAADAARRTSATLSREQLGAALQLFKSAAGLHANKEYDAAKLGLERALAIDPGNALGQFCWATRWNGLRMPMARASAINWLWRSRPVPPKACAPKRHWRNCPRHKSRLREYPAAVMHRQGVQIPGLGRAARRHP